MGHFGAERPGAQSLIDPHADEIRERPLNGSVDQLDSDDHHRNMYIRKLSSSTCEGLYGFRVSKLGQHLGIQSRYLTLAS